MPNPILTKVYETEFFINTNTDLIRTWVMYPGGYTYLTPVDLTNCSASLAIYANFEAQKKNNPLFSLTTTLTANGGIVLGSTAGTMQLQALKPSSLLLGPGTFPASWYHTWADGTTIKLMRANWIVNP